MTDVRQSAPVKRKSQIPTPAASTTGTRKPKPEDKPRSVLQSTSPTNKRHNLHAPTDISRNNSNDNVPPLPQHPQRGVVKKVNKSSMGYMELKRSHQELASELNATEEKSRVIQYRYQSEVEKLVLELQECRKTNTALKEELLTYQETVREKNSTLDVLQLRLNDIKLENDTHTHILSDRISNVLESSRIDAVTGKRIEKTIELLSTHKETKAKMEGHAVAINTFISQLESTVLQLQEQNCQRVGKADLQRTMITTNQDSL